MSNERLERLYNGLVRLYFDMGEQLEDDPTEAEADEQKLQQLAVSAIDEACGSLWQARGYLRQDAQRFVSCLPVSADVVVVHDDKGGGNG